MYLDMDVLIGYLVSGDPHHERATDLLTHLSEHGLTTIYLSSVAWAEYHHHVCKATFRAALPEEEQRRLRLDHWDEPLIRSAYLQGMLAKLDSLLAQFEWIEIPFGPAIRLKAADYMAQYNLGAHDAVHLASALSEEVFDFASFDRGYRRVDGLYLWNDCMYGN